LRVELIIDTAVFALTTALFVDGDIRWQVHIPSHLGHQEILGPTILSGFEETGLALDELTTIGVTIGPGSFSGLRMGLGFAKGLSRGLIENGQSVNLLGINVLDAFLFDPRLDAIEGEILALMDAGRDRYFARSRTKQSFKPPFQGIVSEILHDQKKLDGFEAVISGPFRDFDASANLGAIVSHGPGAHGLYRALCSSHAVTQIKPLYLREADATVSQKLRLNLG
jgi:tRNA threonylcarbamoyladenosine biosynthesis protein TsaB